VTEPPDALALEATNVSVAFGGTRALRDASLFVKRGTIHALLGENGSGKSTFIKVLAGLYAASPGGVIRAGDISRATEQMTPASAYELGMRFVHQDLGLFDDMSVAENMALYTGYPTAALGAIRWRSVKRVAAERLERFEIDATPDTLVGDLRPAMRTMVAVARALQGDSSDAGRILVLDEPTVSLPRHEADLLLQILGRRADGGDAVVFISHRLDEVLASCHELTVLRDGQTIATLDASSATEQDVGRLITGRTIERHRPGQNPAGQTGVAAEIKHLKAAHVSVEHLVLQAGEVVGLAGLVGSGRSTLLRSIFGDIPDASGTIRVGPKAGPFRSPSKAMAAGIAYVPEDRIREGVFADMSVTANLSISVLGKYFRGLWLQRKAEDAAADQLISTFGVKCGSRRDDLSTLSGGNQQKLVLARWLQRRPRLLLLDEPTQGVDIAARADIYQLMRRATADGCAVLLASSDLEELSELCDRVFIMSGGELVDELRPPRTGPAELFERVQAPGRRKAA
jgi:ribose transport system ATP-binding protein